MEKEEEEKKTKHKKNKSTQENVHIKKKTNKDIMRDSYERFTESLSVVVSSVLEVHKIIARIEK